MRTAEDHASLYRVLDTTYGCLELLCRIEDELMQSRLVQLRARQSQLQAPSLLVLGALATAIPTLYSMVENDVARNWAIVLVITTGVIYAAMIAKQWWDLRQERKSLDTDLPAAASVRELHDRPSFIKFQISSYGTRLSMARSVLDAQPPEPLKKKFENARQHWVNLLLDLNKKAASLEQRKALSPEDAGKIKEWLSIAMDGAQTPAAPSAPVPAGERRP